MSDRCHKIEMSAGEIFVDAELLGTLLGLEPAAIPSLLRNRTITSFCERGTGADEGRHRLTFFHGNRRARLVVDSAGLIVSRSTINFGEHGLPRQLHRAGT
ncbi:MULTISPECIES: DUF6522 family protein [unclassified Mesorhizobium]|uniref:DUF6522 family protein n=1 Tax=unclassified Mesorhizobium TaxID=325217 RepID=UPI00241619F7|nr:MULTISPECIES: DUF6522 family protein [unclassified Mesorhizobium]MDG4892371.1 DUF6522 family protein [Mesorhizobium sp. WSM4976]